MNKTQDYITPVTVQTLSGLFYERLKRSPDKTAYQYYCNGWKTLSWKDIANKTELWHTAFRHESLVKGDRVAIMMRNCPDWVVFDQAAFSLGLVVVPIYTNDRAENIRYILEDANVKVFFIEELSYCENLLRNTNEIDLKDLKRIVTHDDVSSYNSSLLAQVKDWLPSYTETIQREDIKPNDLATIVYTSGTTGRPKGVMLSHNNIFINAYSASIVAHFDTDDIFMSFLPLSHMFERTAGYYMPMIIGAEIAYARSIEKLGEDLLSISPTILVTVPRIFERVYNKIHDQLSKKSTLAKFLFELAVNVGWRRFLVQQKKEKWHLKLILWPILKKLVAGKILAKLGGNLQLAVSGGAALSPEIAKTFIGLGLNISQGYGLTETSPIVSTNKLYDNDPFSVGQALLNIEVKLGDDDELLVRGETVMLGYWNNEAASSKVIGEDGWFHTGDIARIENKHIYITGRIKEIIVLSNGEKVPPADIELAINTDPLFEQVIVIGEAKPYLTAIITIDKEVWSEFTRIHSVVNNESSFMLDNIYPLLMDKINKRLFDFPGYTKVMQAHFVLEPWGVESGLITPTLKLKRTDICERYSQEIMGLYDGH